MTNMSKIEVFGIELKIYLKANKEEKSKILDALERQTKMHRKSIVRRFKREQLRQSGDTSKRGRKMYYTPDVTEALKYIWEAGEEQCGENTHPIINEYINIFIRDNMWNFNDEVTLKLRAMSLGTVKNRVGNFMKTRSGKGKSTTNPSNIKERIPVFCGPWRDVPTGHGQIDTVVHCGSTLAGNMLYSVSYTDVNTGWWQGRAQFNKGMEATKDNLSYIKDHLEIPWFHAHPDCGSEFLNKYVIDWSVEENMKFTRSRSYHKNDNGYVEQKNGHIIRKVIGYRRLDAIHTVAVLNQIYEKVSLHRNFFVAQQKLISKERIGARYKTKHDKGKTPYKSVLSDDSVSDEVKDNLNRIYDTINPLELKQEISQLKSKLFKLQARYGSDVR